MARRQSSGPRSLTAWARPDSTLPGGARATHEQLQFLQGIIGLEEVVSWARMEDDDDEGGRRRPREEEEGGGE